MSQAPTQDRIRVVRLLAVLLLAMCALNATGCTYLEHRGEDALETFDIGITLSKRAQLSLYANGASFISFGYSKFKGTLLGMGGGFFGIVEHENLCKGNGFYGEEKLVWDKKRKPQKSYTQKQGIYGIQVTLQTTRKLPPPAYFPACVHNFHFGWIGIVGNIRYSEMVDFILGFTTFDLAHDDGRTRGRWFFY